MKRPPGLLRLLLAASLALGCQRGPEQFMPLGTGQRTVYDLEYSTVLGGVQRAEAVVRIEEKTEIGGKEYYRVAVAIKGIPGHEPEVYYQRFAADGLHELRYVGDRPVDYLYIPWPLRIGTAWLVNAAGIEMTCRAESRVPAVLPEKTYDDAWKISCYGLRAGSRFKNQTYLVEGVGPVRVVQEMGALTMEMRLREAG